jgi:hypothetical protein
VIGLETRHDSTKPIRVLHVQIVTFTSFPSLLFGSLRLALSTSWLHEELCLKE